MSAEYEPLDLGPLYNGGVDLYHSRGPMNPPTGKQEFHGLPFQIGTPGGDGDRIFIHLGQTGEAATSVTIPVGQAAHHVIVAHALLETKIFVGGHPGESVATYAFRYEDGECETVPIRDRFEIGVAPFEWKEAVASTWGHTPLLAVFDAKDGVQPHWVGRFGEAGLHPSEVLDLREYNYYLWAWANPRPEVPIAALELKASGSELVVAGVTLSHLAEEPLGRAPAREIVIEADEAAEYGPEGAFEVEIDRGLAGYAFPLPDETLEQFLAGDLRGFGVAPGPTRRAYAKVSANPSATVRINRGGRELGKLRGAELEPGKVLEPSKGLRVEVKPYDRNWVHTTVVDEDTGEPIPCRVHFRSPDGIPYAPHGHHAHINSELGTLHFDIGGDVRLGQVSYAYIDGRCQGWLPQGDVIVDVARGFEYEPLRAKVRVERGQRELELRLKRVADLRNERYFSGDSHVHFLATQGGELEAKGEDLSVINVLQTQWGHLYTSTEEFTGRPHVSEDGNTIVYVSQENRQHVLGHLSLLGLKEPVMPFCSDGPDEGELGGTLETTMCHWADECHAQDGTVILPHLPAPNGEPAALIATGRADATEMLVHTEYNHLEYYRYLNAGYRLPLVGGTDKMTSEVPVGLYRTYAHIPAEEEFSYEAWCRAVRSGNTFLSGGPLIRMVVDGQPMGATVALARGGGTVEVAASADSIFPINALEVVAAGQVVASTEEPAGARHLELRAQVKVEADTWLAARCAGPGHQVIRHNDEWRRGVMAHTSPVYVACGGEYERFDSGAANYMLTLIDGSLSYIRQRSRQYPAGAVTHHHGEEDHQAFLERPFHEAAEAIHRRMHEAGVPH